MGFMDSFLNAMKLNPDEDDYDEDDFEEEAPVEFKEKKKYKEAEVDDYEEDLSPRKNLQPRKASAKAMKRTSASGMGGVIVLKPTEFNDAIEITDALLANRTVVLNLESAVKLKKPMVHDNGDYEDIPQRIIDFAYGSIYAIKGNMQQVSKYTFVLTPASVDISADDPEIEDGGAGIPFRK